MIASSFFLFWLVVVAAVQAFNKFPVPMPDFRGTSRRLEIDVSPPLYILAWYNCKGKDEIVRMMDQSGLRYCLINVNLDTPLFYRDEELIADNVFDIYFYLYHKYF